MKIKTKVTFAPSFVLVQLLQTKKELLKSSNDKKTITIKIETNSQIPNNNYWKMNNSCIRENDQENS